MNYIQEKYNTLDKLRWIATTSALFNGIYFKGIDNVSLLNKVLEIEQKNYFKCWEKRPFIAIGKSDEEIINEFKKHMVLHMVDNL